MRTKLAVAILLAMVCVISPITHAYAQTLTNEQEIDLILERAETPKDVIDAMDIQEKYLIASTIDADMKYIKVTEEPSGAKSSGDYEISSSDLKLTVTAYKNGSQVSIYPKYEWLTKTKPKGKDYFGYATSNSYSAVSGARSNTLYYKLSASDGWTSGGSAVYTGSSMYGYQHKGTSLGTPDVPLYLKGCFYYKVDIDVQNPVKKIALAYVHDTSSGGSFSYGVSYGAGSISITPQSTNVGYKNGIYNLNY